MPATIPLSYSLSCLTLRASPQVKMTPDGSRLPVDDRSGKRLPLTAGSSGRALGPRDRRHRRRSSSVSCSTWSYPVCKSGRYDYTGNHHRSLLSSLPGRLEHGAATEPWLLRESPGPPDQARPPVNQGPVCPTVARVTRRAHPSSGRAGSANPATLNRPAPQQSPTLASESVNLSPRLKGRYTTHCLEAQSCAALLDPGFFASRIFSISTTFSPSTLPPSPPPASPRDHNSRG